MASLTPISGTLGKERAAHLLRRATFGPTKQDIDAFAGKTAAEALSLLTQPITPPTPPRDTKTGLPWNNPTNTNVNSENAHLQDYIVAWWMDRMVRSEINLTERMVYFYHTHFTTIQSRMHYNLALYYQNVLFRHYAFGNIKDLALKLCLDNAMLMNLDGFLNEVGRPNENYAREFLELYTIGKGPQIGPEDYTNYTEQDVQEAARVLSGFKFDRELTRNIDPETGIPLGYLPLNGNQEPAKHDFKSKTFSSKFRNTTITPTGKDVDAVMAELQTFVDMVFEQKETAKHLCRKIYRFFVYYDITDAIEANVIEPLADVLIANNFEILPVLQTLLQSQHFYDQYDQDNKVSVDNIKGALIKSPLEIIAGSLRYFKVALPDPNQGLKDYYELYRKLLRVMQDQDLELYEPFDVAGYDAYHQAPDYNRNWISSNNLAQRYIFASQLIEGAIETEDTGKKIQLDVMQFINNPANVADPTNPETLVKGLIDDMFPEIVSEERISFFLNDVFLDNFPKDNWTVEWNKYKQSGDDSIVRMLLERLITKLMQTPEYQLF